MTRRIFAFAVLVVLASRFLEAHGAERRWIELKSGVTNTLVISNGNEADAQRLLTAIEDIQQLVSRALADSVRDDGEPLIVIAPRDSGGMRELVGDNAKRNRGLLVAASLPAPYSHYLAVNLDARQSRRTQLLQHEYLHQVTQTVLPDPPGWLDEGLSEFWSTLLVTDRDARVGAEIAHHVRALRSQKWIPLDQLVAIKRGQYDQVKGKLGLFYAQSWLLVHYLIAGSGAQTTSPSYAPELPADLSALEKRLRAYAASPLPTLKLRLRDATTQSPNVSLRVLAPEESLAYRASAILYSDGEAGRSLANQALALNPSEPLALEVKGISFFLANQRSEAQKWLELAVAQPTASFRAHYYYGVASVDTPEIALRHLKRSLELKPGFAPALQRLGHSPNLRQFFACACR